MVPKEHRLSDQEEIRRVFRLGRKAFGSLFSFTFLQNSLEKSRFTIVVSKKIFPHAVDRNRTKRLVRESIRHVLPRIAPGYDGVFSSIRKPTDKLDFKEVTAEIETLLHRTNIFS